MENEENSYLEAVEVRLSHLVGMAFSGHRVGSWCFSAKTQNLFFSSAMHEIHMEKFFRLGGCHDYAFREARGLTVPFLMSDRLGMIWLGENFSLSNGSPMLVVMGPMFYASTSPEYVDALLRKLVFDGEIPPTEVGAYRTVLSDVPIVPAQTVVAYARMLHFSIVQKTLATGDIHYQTEKLQQASAPVKPEDRSWVDYSLVHSQEEMFLQCVREGNLNYMEVLNGLNYSVLDLPLSGSPVRRDRKSVV